MPKKMLTQITIDDEEILNRIQEIKLMMFDLQSKVKKLQNVCDVEIHLTSEDKKED